MSGETKGAREAIDRMTRNIVNSSNGQVSRREGQEHRPRRCPPLRPQEETLIILRVYAVYLGRLTP